MFTTFLPTVGTDSHEFVPPPIKPQQSADKTKKYGDALRSYRERHPDATDEDIALIKKEGGDLESLFFWGVTPEDAEDAAIIAKQNPETGADNQTVITDLNHDGTPSNEKKNESRQLFPFNVFEGSQPRQQQSQPSNQPPSSPQRTNDGVAKKRKSITYVPPFPFNAFAEPGTPTPVVHVENNNNVNKNNNISIPFMSSYTVESHNVNNNNISIPYLSSFTFTSFSDPQTTESNNTNTTHYFTRDLPQPTVTINSPPTQTIHIPSVSTSNPHPQPVNITSETPSILPNLNPFLMFSHHGPVTVPISHISTSEGIVEDPHLRSLVDQEEIKVLKNQLAARNINNGGEIDFFRKQLSDSEKTQKILQKQYDDLSAEHSVCGDLKIRLASAEQLIAALQNESKQKDKDLIKYKCDGQRDRDEISRLQVNLRQFVADAGATRTTSDILSTAQQQAEDNRIELEKLRIKTADSNRTITNLVVESKRDKDEIKRLTQTLEDTTKKWTEMKEQGRHGHEQSERLRQQLADVEIQQRTWAANANAIRQQTEYKTMNDDLKRQLEDMTQRKRRLEEQAQIDHDTIMKLKQQLETQQQELQRVTSQPVDVIQKRVQDLSVINATLLSLARDPSFQQDLTRPLVKIALGCWAGETHHTEEQMDAARYDEGVKRIYPRLKAFERQCDDAIIPFPVEHVINRRTELRPEAVAQLYGADFVAKYHAQYTKGSGMSIK